MIQHETDLKSTWFAACRIEDVVHNGGVCVQYGDSQIALFFSQEGMNGMLLKTNARTKNKWH